MGMGTGKKIPHERFEVNAMENFSPHGVRIGELSLDGKFSVDIPTTVYHYVRFAPLMWTHK